MGPENYRICLKTDVVTLERGEMSKEYKESPYNLIDVLGHFSVIFTNHYIFVKLNFAMLPVMVRLREKS